jgi:hypothetical protein
MQNTMLENRLDNCFIPAADDFRREESFIAIGEETFMMPPESLKSKTTDSLRRLSMALSPTP